MFVYRCCVARRQCRIHLARDRYLQGLSRHGRDVDARAAEKSRCPRGAMPLLPDLETKTRDEIGPGSSTQLPSARSFGIRMSLIGRQHAGNVSFGGEDLGLRGRRAPDPQAEDQGRRPRARRRAGAIEVRATASRSMQWGRRRARITQAPRSDVRQGPSSHEAPRGPEGRIREPWSGAGTPMPELVTKGQTPCPRSGIARCFRLESVVRRRHCRRVRVPAPRVVLDDDQRTACRRCPGERRGSARPERPRAGEAREGRRAWACSHSQVAGLVEAQAVASGP